MLQNPKKITIVRGTLRTTLYINITRIHEIFQLLTFPHETVWLKLSA